MDGYNFPEEQKECYMRKVKLAGTIPLCFLKEKDSFVAFSPALDLSTCGRTFDEAKKNFSEALEIFFEECISMGTLKEVLESCGWEKDREKGWEPPTYIGESRIELPLLASA
jgi:predicted RNase H-like HicB family nuclease